MDVLLINPGWMTKEGNIWKKISGSMPPLGLAYIASYLEKNGISVRIIDEQAEREPLSILLGAVTGVPRFVGITATTMTASSAVSAAALCRAKFPDARIVLGGVHPTIMPEDMLKNDTVDYVVRGEGERPFLMLAQGVEAGKIPGLSYKKDGKYVNNPEGELIKDLDELPFPAYNLLPVKKYVPTLGSYKRLPAISFVATRGCPGKCTFCLGSYLGGRVRMHSIRYIIDEIKMLQRDFGIREIEFYDDTFTAFKPKVREFCNTIIQEKMDITWVCFARVDFVDEEILRLMKQAGCHQIMYGIESGNEQILKNIKKMTSLDKAREVVALTKKAGIECRAAFMLGNMGETEETMRQTMDFAKSLDPDIALFNIATPYPGTEMYKWADESGYLKTKDWAKYDLSTAVVELPTVSSQKIEEYYHRAHKEFYGRPGYLFKRLLKIRSITDLIVSMKAAFAIFKGNKGE
jgi:anaerobic magnesium-protoporphyrin IX monomethyl ester cyclase